MKKQTNYYMVKKKQQKNKIVTWCATSGTPCIRMVDSGHLDFQKWLVVQQCWMNGN